MRAAIWVRVARLALLAVPSIAAADPLPLIHVDAGPELEADQTVSSSALRGQLVLGQTLGHGRVRPELAAGALGGGGTLYVPDPRGVGNQVGLSMYTFGPVAQLGLQFYQGDEPTTRLFASASYLYVGLDKRLMVDAVPGVGGSRGDRESIGINFARNELRRVGRSRDDTDWLLLFLLPQQAELTREQDAGSTRYGVTLSWGS